MSDTELPYTTLPTPPRAMTAGAVLARLVDALGFRYRWATEGLEQSDAALRPGAASMSLGGLLEHVHQLVHWLDGVVSRDAPRSLGPGRIDTSAHAPLSELREETLTRLALLRDRLVGMDDDDLGTLRIESSRRADPLPFWYALNGPLADALTHVGQINAWRRLAERPAPAADVFFGRPPA